MNNDIVDEIWNATLGRVDGVDWIMGNFDPAYADLTDYELFDLIEAEKL